MSAWKDRAIGATHGTQLGAILACALGHEIPAPYFSGKASITSDGFVMCNFTRANGDCHMGALVGAASELKHNVVGLADHLKLNAEERKEFAEVIVAWIGLDYCDISAQLRKAVTNA